jgi:hypothetical protein
MNRVPAIAHVRDVLRKTERVLSEMSPWFDFTKGSTDGRINSLNDEDKVTQFILAHPDIKEFYVKKEEKEVKKVKKSKKSTKKRSKETADEEQSDECEKNGENGENGEKEEKEENNRAFGDIGIDLTTFGSKEPFPCNVKIIAEANRSGNNSCGLIHLVGYTFQRRCSNHDRVMEVLIDLDKIREKGEHGFGDIEPQFYGIIMVMKEKRECWLGTFDEIPEKYIGTNPSNPLQIPFLKPTDRVSRTDAEYIDLLIKKIVEYHTKKSRPLAIWNDYYNSKPESKPEVESDSK